MRPYETGPTGHEDAAGLAWIALGLSGGHYAAFSPAETGSGFFGAVLGTDAASWAWYSELVRMFRFM